MKQKVLLSALLLTVCTGLFAQTDGLKPLKDAYAGSFKIGCAISSFEISGRNQKAENLLVTNFNALSPGNELKPERLHPRPDVWNWGPADNYIKFGKEHGMWLLGHTLCWHNQTPDFFWNNEDGTPKSHDELVETLRSYIETVCTHFAGKVDAWDVINEIIGEHGEYRDKGWVKAFGGPEYGDEIVKTVFRFASQYAPDTELYYNEFNVWRPSKLEGIIRMVKMLQAEGIRIDGVGIQAHWGLNYPKTEYIEDAINKLSALGIKVMITELDVDVLPLTKEGQVIGHVMEDPQFQFEEFKVFLDPYRDGLPEEVEIQQGKRYEELFQIFYNHRSQIDRVTFWGLHDGSSWKNGYPIPGRINYPHLWNRDLTPHYGLKLVLDIPSK